MAAKRAWVHASQTSGIAALWNSPVCRFRNTHSMKVAVVKETRAHERRVAASPDTVKRMVAMGLEVVAERGAGEEAGLTDAAFAAAGATMAADPASALGGADIVLKVQRPQT